MDKIKICLVDTYSIAHGFESVREAPRRDSQADAILASVLALAAEYDAERRDHEERTAEELPKNARYFDLAYAEKVVHEIELVFTGAGGVIGAYAFLKLVRDTVVKWREVSSRHKVKIKIGDRQLEITGSKNVEKAMQLLASLTESASTVGNVAVTRRVVAPKPVAEASTARKRRQRMRHD